MTTTILDTNEDEIVKNDLFTVTEVTDCGDIFMLKTSSLLNPCPITWTNFLLPYASFIWNIPEWCYDWSELFIWQDINLAPDNVKVWVDIFNITWTYLWATPTWLNEIIPDNSLTKLITPAIHDWTKTVTASSINLLSGNIKNWITIFGTTWNYVWEPNPTAFTYKWYHVWYTHWAEFIDDDKVVLAYSKWAVSDANNVYLCYSSWADVWINNVVYTTVLRYNISSWVLSTIINDVVINWTYTWTRFREWPTSATFRVMLNTTAGSPYSYREVTLATWAVTSSTTATLWAFLANSATLDWKTYTPYLTNTTSLNEYSYLYSYYKYRGQSLNVNISS